ncbi:calcium/sodium antiporter [Jannaschia aquimarina]|uniref:YrbG_1 protein n=1 Tax=Jannaschia aquimarina TaxID=935700 RepID=A0A0D1EM39_9RHOB|nr:calcium/sodium antiporter [Jannaschia aquimarina]KIT18046.1 Inner membrane protein YrbG [Jannaschia aquimarina]SNS89213.1 cation:H+ antiporter [Jannaschia aquimarina]
MLLETAFLAAGCGLLFLGGDWLVDGIAGLAGHLRVPPVIVAFVVMGFGTSAPELFVAINAMSVPSPDVAMGNIVGSNIANLLLVLAITALIAPLSIDRDVLRIDGTAMLVGALALAFVCSDGVVSVGDAVGLVAGMLCYLALRWRSLPDTDEAEDPGAHRLWAAAAVCLAALVALPLGANLFIGAAIDIAGRLGVSEAMIGLTVVALGTSLPELAACVAAVLRRHSGMILGGILGSNVFNGTIVLAGAAIVAPVGVGDAFLTFWIPVMVGASVVTLAFLRTGYILCRREAAVMLVAYAALFVPL